MRRDLKILILLVVTVSLGACDRGEEPIPARKLRSLVLQPQDVGTAFVAFDLGPQEFADYSAGPRQNPRRFEREGGWKARYKRSGSPETKGPLVVVSFADVFRTEDGAERDLAAYRAEFEAEIDQTEGEAGLVRVPVIGNGTWAMTLIQGSGATALRYYTIAWRKRNVTALVRISGFDREVSLEVALELARKQNRRIG